MKRKKLEKSGFLAVQVLRNTKLSQGLPFMINSSELPSDQCYLEYPDGSLYIVTICQNNKDFKVVSHLSNEEGQLIISQLNLA